MKISSFVVGLLAVISPVTAAWSKDDREIFRVRAEIEAAEGKDVTFYDYMGISKKATTEDIKKAYRQMTRQLHPDKVRQRLVASKSSAALAAATDKSKKPKVAPPTAAELKRANKIAIDKQARLTIINDILRGPARQNYDFYLSNGFPLWKGTDYFYSRFRPGFGTVLIGLFVAVGGGVHFIALYVSWKQNYAFVERTINNARASARETYGSVAMARPAAPVVEEEETEPAAPIPRNRKERRMMEKHERSEGKKPVPKRKAAPAKVVAAEDEESDVEEIGGPVGARRRVLAKNGKVLIVDSQDDVWLEYEDDNGKTQYAILDIDEVAKPTIHDTALVRVPMFFVNTVKSRLGLGTPATNYDVAEEVDEDSEDFELLEASVDDLGAAKSSGSQKPKATKRR